MSEKKTTALLEQDGNHVALDIHKDNIFYSQCQRVYDFFISHTTTMYDAEKQTGVCRPSICRYVHILEDGGKLQRVYKGICPVSGYTAYFFTSDTSLFKTTNAVQQTLFNREELDHE